MSYVLLSDLADECGTDRSNMRKYVLKHGFLPVQVRTAKSRGQLQLALTDTDAEAVRELRQRQGFGLNQPTENGHGVFYVVQVIPDLDPLRVKLGFATDALRRLDSYRTLSPTVQLVKTWPCRSSWERAAIDSLSRICTPLSGEVFTCDDLLALVARGDAFFALMSD